MKILVWIKNKIEKRLAKEMIAALEKRLAIYHNVGLFVVLDRVKDSNIYIDFLVGNQRAIERYEDELILAKAKINEDYRYTGLTIK